MIFQGMASMSLEQLVVVLPIIVLFIILEFLMPIVEALVKRAHDYFLSILEAKVEKLVEQNMPSQPAGPPSTSDLQMAEFHHTILAKLDVLSSNFMRFEERLSTLEAQLEEANKNNSGSPPGPELQHQGQNSVCHEQATNSLANVLDSCSDVADCGPSGAKEKAAKKTTKKAIKASFTSLKKAAGKKLAKLFRRRK